MDPKMYNLLLTLLLPIRSKLSHHVDIFSVCLSMKCACVCVFVCVCVCVCVQCVFVYIILMYNIIIIL